MTREQLLEKLCHHLRFCLRCHDNANGYTPVCATRTRLWVDAGLGETPYPVEQDPPHPEAQPLNLDGRAVDGITEITLTEPRLQ